MDITFKAWNFVPFGPVRTLLATGFSTVWFAPTLMLCKFMSLAVTAVVPKDPDLSFVLRHA